MRGQFEGIEVIVDENGFDRRSIVEEAMAAGVKYFQAQATGLDHLPLDLLRSRSVLVAHCPGRLSSVALAEQAMMMMLMLSCRYKEAKTALESRQWQYPTSRELLGGVLLIVGLGASGQELARRSRGFGMQITAIDPRPIEKQVLDNLQVQTIGTPDDLDDFLGQCDYVSLHLPLTTHTRQIIDRRRIRLIKPTACLINVARGDLVDEAALHAALEAGHIGGAGLDVFTDEPVDPTLAVYQLPNVVVTPHHAGSSNGTSRRRAAFALENLNRYAQGEEIEARVQL